MIFSFQYPHKIGSVCADPCEQCRVSRVVLLDATGIELPRLPLYIVRESTREQWITDCIANGGTVPHCIHDLPFFYEVSTD